MLYFKGEANPIISEAKIEMLYVQANQFALVGWKIFFIGSKYYCYKKYLYKECNHSYYLAKQIILE